MQRVTQAVPIVITVPARIRAFMMDSAMASSHSLVSDANRIYEVFSDGALGLRIITASEHLASLDALEMICQFVGDVVPKVGRLVAVRLRESEGNRIRQVHTNSLGPPGPRR